MIQPALYTLIQQVEQAASSHQLWHRGDRIVVAVSGGPDSMALLHVLHQLAKRENHRLELIIAHVNHGFREASTAEAQMVQRAASELGWPCVIHELDMPRILAEQGGNSQAVAREHRYAFLHRIATDQQASHIALAHHADDQAETVMMRLLRGSGASGLAGMMMNRQEKNVQLIRPLLRINKTALVACCEACGIPYAEDLSNQSRKYVRNQIRLDVLPFLGQYNQQITKALNRTADLLGADNEYLEQAAQQLLDHMLKQVPGGYSFSRNDFQKAHVALQRRCIKLILSYLAQNRDSEKDAFDYEKVEAIRHGILQSQPTTWLRDISDELICQRVYEQIVFIHKQEFRNVISYAYDLHQDGGEQLLPMDQGLLHWEVVRRSSNSLLALKPRHRYEALFDAAELQFPLIVRNRRSGDRMHVLGLNGTKKVQDIFIDDKLAPQLREQWPIVTDANDCILWIPGIRRSSHAVIQPHTVSVLHLELCDPHGKGDSNISFEM